MKYLFKSLLHWFLFSGTMFFAAGAVDLGVLDGAIDDSADLGDNGASDQASSDDAAGVSREESVDGTRGADDAGAEKANDGRTLPKSVQGALKTLKEAHPELAKEIDELRKGYFDSRGHREFFKSPAEARQAKATLELVGGSEGIATLQSRISEAEQLDSAFEQGDAKVLDNLATDFPDGFKKLVAPALDKLEKLDPVAYGKAMQPHVFSAMEKAGMGQVFGMIGQAIAANDLPKAKDLIEKSLNWYEGQKQQAGQRQNTDDPDRAKLATERQQFEQQKETAFRQDIGRQTHSNQISVIDKSLAPYLKSKALNADQKADLIAGVHEEVRRLLKADGTYQGQVKALLAAKGRDPQKIIAYINPAVDEAVKKAVPTVWRRRGFGSGPAQRATTATTTTTDKGAQQQNPANTGGPVLIAAKPNRADIDWAKTKDVLFITNKAYMKSGPYKGKLVRWK